MKSEYSFTGTVEKFPGAGGWIHVAVPGKYTLELKKQRQAWGMFPIIARVGNAEWKTKLMLKKGGNFFVALRSDVRKKIGIAVGKQIKISFKLL